MYNFSIKYVQVVHTLAFLGSEKGIEKEREF